MCNDVAADVACACVLPHDDVWCMIKHVITTKCPLMDQFYLMNLPALTYLSHSLYFSNVRVIVLYFFCR